MLTLEDCIEICGLTHEEITYLVEHEHISDLRAAELGERYITVDESDTPHIRRSILKDIAEMKKQGKQKEAEALECFIRDFVLSHPDLNRTRPKDTTDS